jgi:hypothetical protein
VSDKRLCPACQSYTSTVLGAFERGDPCPYCGLSASAASELIAAQERGANAEVVERAGVAERRAEAAEREAARLRWLLKTIREAVGQVDAAVSIPAPPERR